MVQWLNNCRLNRNSWRARMEQMRSALQAAPDGGQARAVWQRVAVELESPSIAHGALVRDLNAAAVCIRANGAGRAKADLDVFDRKLFNLAALMARDEGFVAQDADACAVAATKQALALQNKHERTQLYAKLTGINDWRTLYERLQQGEAP